MKIKIERIAEIVRNNIRKVTLIFLAFMLMAAAAFFLIGHTIKQRLIDRANEIISVSEANVRTGFSEVETILLNTGYFVQKMLNQNAPAQNIYDFLSVTTQWMRHREGGLFNYYGVYGYINDEFIDSIGLNPDSDYIPQTRPWYQAAGQSGASVGYTVPYTDWRTGDTLISAVYNIFDNDRNNAGILVIDVEIGWLTEYVNSFAPASGILLNQNMTVMAHHDNSLIGMSLQDLGKSYFEIAGILRSGGEVTARSVKGDNEMSGIAFFTQLFNGWYMGIVMPYHKFYGDLYVSALILFLLGLVLFFLLCYMLLRLSSAGVRYISASYKFSSLVNDTVDIVRIQLGEKPVRFFTNIDSAVPCRLLGDEVRFRQALLNLLLNSIKHTEKGFIGLFITVEKFEEKKVWLKITVTDTGEKPFNESVWIDLNGNSITEGKSRTGFPVIKRLCAEMNGEFFMESEPGKGSTFTMTIMQEIESPAPFAAVKEPVKKKVLIYEGRIVHAKSLSWSLENMHVPHVVVTNQAEFSLTLHSGEWFYIFSGYGLYKKIKPLLAEEKFLNGKKPFLALMTETGTEESIPDVRFIPLPVNTLSIAGVLENETDSRK
ncbi:MAG: ATP-binding protein [Treponema sp.]|nr:ATP-binding protein [Treponema sp.]MCL2272245.1 ATP-binding protein [Treponema sp.]